MMRFAGYGSVTVGVAVLLCATPACAQPDEDMPPAGRPWFGVCLSSLEQLHDNIDAALRAAERPELAEVLATRLERWQNLKGIDRTRPVGLVRFWPHRPEASPEEVVFIPATNRTDLMKTVTFGAVEFQAQSPDHYVIARPGSPYHVLFRNENVAWMGDRTQTIATCSRLYGEWTSELVKDHDLGVFWDLRQVPVELRRTTAETWRAVLEPLLQQRDGEADELYDVRRAWTAPLLQGAALAIEQTRRIVLRLRFEKDGSAAVLTMHVLAEPKSEWASALNSWRPARSVWQELQSAKAARSSGFVAGLPAVRWPGRDAPPAKSGGQLAWQVFGENLALRVAVLAVSDGPADAATPTLSSEVSSLKRVRVPSVPEWLRHWIGGNTEAWLARDRGMAWLGFGIPELAQKRLSEALDAARTPPEKPREPVCLSARIPLRECLDAIPWFDRAWMHEELLGREDRIDVTVTPITDGLQVRAVLPTGVLRLIGGMVADDLAREADRLIFTPPE